MSKRRAFIPTAPGFSTLEGRLAPSSGFAAIGSFFDKLGDQLGITHHSSAKTASDGIKQLWAESDKLSKPVHQAVAAHHAANSLIKIK